MNALFNTAVDGRAACWLYFSGTASISLASDDGSLWASQSNSSPTVGNSQCTLSNYTLLDGSPGNWGFTVTITFSHSFAGTKNIFMRGDNTEGGDTGYTLQGSWTVP